MKRKLFVIPSLFTALCLTTSCNKDSISINRTIFKDSDYTTVKTRFDNMTKNQTKKEGEDDTTNLYDKGTINLKRKISAKGSFREDEISFHNINVSMSSGFDISWSMQDKYLKIAGENEIIYYKGDENNKFTHYYKNWQNGSYYAYKHSVDSEVEEFTTYKDYFVDLIDYYTVTYIPFLFIACGGINSANNYMDSTIIKEQLKYKCQPSSLFSDKLNTKVKELQELYKDNKDGYNINCTYGTNDENTVCSHLRGKIAHKDVDSKWQLGYFNIDNFVSFKNNFLSQLEYKVDGKIIAYRDVNANFDIDMHISEQVNEGECTVDTINPSEYRDD